MVKKLFLQSSVFSLILCLFVFKPAHAVLAKLTPEQLQEAIEYGQKNKNLDIAAFFKAMDHLVRKRPRICLTIYPLS